MLTTASEPNQQIHRRTLATAPLTDKHKLEQVIEL